jgi:hypothetical protein
LSFSTFRYNKAILVFSFFLLTLVAVYSVHLFTFTLFEGFSTFSNDAGAYMLLARKLSPFFDPGVAVLNSWPVHVYPPGFPWVLAVSGASMTLYTAHVLVSICVLASIVLFGYMARRELGAWQGGLLVLAMCLLPGVIIFSMGILSENLYLLSSLSALLLYSKIKANDHALAGWTLVLLILITLTILTRTIGVALALAVAVAPFFDKDLQKRQKMAFFGAGVSSLVLWQLWGMVEPQSNGPTYFDILAMSTRNLDELPSIATAFWAVIQTNLLQIITSFNHYLSLTNSSVWFFLFSFALLLLCLITLGLRLRQFEADAIYLVLYLVVLAIWPYPEEMTRFLHPIMFLLILQPAVYFTQRHDKQQKKLIRRTVLLVTGVLIFNSIYLQASMVKLRNEARANSPAMVNSFHYYDEPSKERGELLSRFYAGVTTAMTESARYFPADNVVAVIKHENFVILTDRQAITLSTLVPHIQQLCNLKQMNVDVVFLSHMTTAHNVQNVTLLDDYRSISSDVWSMGDEGERVWAHVMFVDKIKLDRELESRECLSYQFNR